MKFLAPYKSLNELYADIETPADKTLRKKALKHYSKSVLKEQYKVPDAEEILEHIEIAEVVEKRLKDHDRSHNVPWAKIKKKYGSPKGVLK